MFDEASAYCFEAHIVLRGHHRHGLYKETRGSVRRSFPFSFSLSIFLVLAHVQPLPYLLDLIKIPDMPLGERAWNIIVLESRDFDEGRWLCIVMAATSQRSQKSLATNEL